MKIKLLFILCLSLFLGSIQLSAQKHDFNWAIGLGYPNILYQDSIWGISFIRFDAPDGNPRFEKKTHFKVSMSTENVILSDSNGHELFLFDGERLVSGGNTVFINGNNIVDPLSIDARQKSVAVPFPGHQNQYFLINKEGTIFPSLGVIAAYNMQYARIAFPDQGGFGEVTEKRKIIIEDTLVLNKMTVNRHANGRDWWLLAKQQLSNNFYAFIIGPNGIKLSHSQSIGVFNQIHDFGPGVYSPNGELYCMMDAQRIQDSITIVNLFDFDRCCGMLSNQRQFTLPLNSLSCGAAFSPNSRFLYLSVENNLYQVDLQVPTPDTVLIDSWEDTYYELANCPTYWGQLINGPDGKIYAGNTKCATRYLNVIDEPNMPGKESKPSHIGLITPTQYLSSPVFPHYRLGPVDGSVCDSLGIDNIPWCWWRYNQDTTAYGTIDFKDLSSYNPTSWMWDFGDGFQSSEQHPRHSYGQPGVYEVCLIVSNDNGADTLCRTIELATVSVNNQIPESLEVEIWPNPFQGTFTLQFSGSYLPLNARFRMYDALGREVYQQQVYSGLNQVDGSSLKGGIYFWILEEENVVLGRGKVIKEGP